MLKIHLENSGRHSQGALWETVFRISKLEMLIESASWLPLASVIPECQSEWCVSLWSSSGE